MKKKKSHNKKKSFRINHRDFYLSNLFLTDHFVQRWKERVDPNMSSEDILNYIDSLHNIKWGIQYESSNFYSLDNDIVIVAMPNNGKIELITVFGRKSENPILTNLQYSNQIYYKYGKAELGCMRIN